MNPYSNTKWQDHVVDGQGNVIQQGTPQSATNFNNIENCVFSNHEMGAVLVQEVYQHKRVLTDFEGETGTVTLTNSETYPWNNSIVTRSLTKNRDTVNYRVIAEIVSSVGVVDGIKISEKAINGFKIAFTGSATSVVVKYYVLGGMYV